MTSHANESSSKTHDLLKMSPFERLERKFECILPKLLLRPFDWRWPGIPVYSPDMDIIDRGKEIIVRAELPGVEEEDLDITVTDHSVCIKADTYRQQKEEKKTYFRQEITQGEFYRYLVLPSLVDETRATSLFEDGVLELSVPKLENTAEKKVEIH